MLLLPVVAAVAPPPQRWQRVARGSVPTITVVGRPNVGKSTFVNRLCDAGGADGAIVRNEPGITRDRIYQRAEWCGREFDVVDTGGLIFDDSPDAVFASEIREQALLALRESCAVVFVVDGRTGCDSVDEQVATFLRKHSLPKVLAVNKCENPAIAIEACADFWSLGLGEPLPCSAVHGNGVAEVLDALLPAIDADAERRAQEPDDHVPTCNVALMGRPNVGKSSLLNRFLGEERSIVSAVPGTTRDAVDERVQVDGAQYRFVDTAGVRRRNRVNNPTEEAMVGRALRAARRSDVVLLVVDSTVEPSDQDAALAQRIADDGRACVVLANKWDIKEEKDEKSTLRVAKAIREHCSAVSWAEVVFVSALTGQRCLKVYGAIDRAVANHRKRVPTAMVNEILRDAILWQPPPAQVAKGGAGKIYFASQVGVSPPTIVAMCNDPRLFTDNYKRYLERKLREALPFEGTPVRLVLRGKRLRDAERETRRRATTASRKSHVKRR